MDNLVLTVAYDGGPFLGWQKSKEGPTIEGELESSITKVLQHKVELQAASRTDAYVHADGQVVNFFSDKVNDLGRFRYSLNCLLPPQIRVLECHVAKGSFHPTLNAVGKEYHYRISTAPVLMPHQRHTVWHCPKVVFRQEMALAAAHFIGRHDFKALCNFRKGLKYTDTHRHLEAIEMVEEGDLLTFHIRGDSFLYKMVRNIVGILVGVGSGVLKGDDILKILASRDRQLAYVTAPAHGLTLHRVIY